MCKITEREIEKYLCLKVSRHQGIAYKFVSPQRRNVPDRLCVFPCGLIYFVECKKEKGKLRPGQAREIKRLLNLGHNAVVVNSKKSVDDLINKIIKKLRNVYPSP